MSHVNSKQRTYFEKSRREGTCSKCQKFIEKGSAAWWGPGLGWRCIGCGNEVYVAAVQANAQLRAPLYICRLVREGSIPYSKAIDSVEAASEIAIDLTRESPVEKLIAVLLDTRNRVIGASEISVGTLNASLVHPREFFRPAILANAASVIVVHNHPSGVLEPGEQDRNVFKRLKEAGRLMGIEVLDSVIVNADGQHLSMANLSYV